MKNFKLNFILLSVLIVSVVMLVLSNSLYFLSGGQIPFDYGIAIDAGSSKTKFFLYDWSSVKTNGTGFVNELATQKLPMSIDEYSEDLPSLTAPLLTTLNQITNKIEYTRKGFEVPIFLGATAGMRLLEKVNAPASAKIIHEIKSEFEKYTAQKRFSVKEVEIISGHNEGLFCWIATNYLMEYIPPPNRTIVGTVGILDMGGASAQIAFQTNAKELAKIDPTGKNLMKTRLFGVNYDVYTYSNLCSGNDDARRRYQYVVIANSNKKSNYVDDPCTHPGQLERTITKEQLLEDVCTNNEKNKAELYFDSYKFRAKPDIKKCDEYTRLVVNKDYLGKRFGEEIPFEAMKEAPPPDFTFFALSTYYYTTSQLRPDATIRFDDEEQLKKEIHEYCAREWSDIVKGIDESKFVYKHNYCFAMNYMLNYLKDVHRFSGKQFNKIEFREKLNGHDLGWSLGYMLQATNSIPDGKVEGPLLNKTQFIIMSVLGVLLFLAVLAIFLKKKYFTKSQSATSSRVQF